MKLTILGVGLSGLSLAYFLQDREEVESIDLIEKDGEPGGLCRSLKKDGYTYDIGPHIFFSRDKEILQFMLDMLPARNDLRRSNQIIYKGRYIQYPFENDLSKLPEEELNYCVTSFKNNPYRGYEAENMLQFFLKTFGEGITNTYLRPYNEKTWKYDPAFMDTQMVERIPQPTDEEIMRSAAGETVDGYVHQLYFHYPSTGGCETLIEGFVEKLGEKCKIHLNQRVEKVSKKDGAFEVMTDQNQFLSDIVISTIPIQELTRAYQGVTDEVKAHVDDLKFNSIIIAFVKTKKDLCGDHFTFTIPEKEVLFHRISKMDFLGEAYKSDGATYIVEITYRKGDYVDRLSDQQLEKHIHDGLLRIGFAESTEDISLINLTRHEYAYVIYDLKHRENMDVIRGFYQGEGIYLNGRFGNFEYWNMDRVIRESKMMAQEIGR